MPRNGVNLSVDAMKTHIKNKAALLSSLEAENTPAVESIESGEILEAITSGEVSFASSESDINCKITDYSLLSMSLESSEVSVDDKQYLTKREQDSEKFLKTAEYYKEYPEKHKRYKKEWSAFYWKHKEKLIKENIDTTSYDYSADWLEHWNKKIVEILIKEYETKFSLRMTKTGRHRSKSKKKSHSRKASSHKSKKRKRSKSKKSRRSKSLHRQSSSSQLSNRTTDIENPLVGNKSESKGGGSPLVDTINLNCETRSSSLLSKKPQNHHTPPRIASRRLTIHTSSRTELRSPSLTPRRRTRSPTIRSSRPRSPGSSLQKSPRSRQRSPNSLFLLQKTYRSSRSGSSWTGSPRRRSPLIRNKSESKGGGSPLVDIIKSNCETTSTSLSSKKPQNHRTPQRIASRRLTIHSSSRTRLRSPSLTPRRRTRSPTRYRSSRPRSPCSSQQKSPRSRQRSPISFRLRKTYRSQSRSPRRRSSRSRSYCAGSPRGRSFRSRSPRRWSPRRRPRSRRASSRSGSSRRSRRTLSRSRSPRLRSPFFRSTRRRSPLSRSPRKYSPRRTSSAARFRSRQRSSRSKTPHPPRFRSRQRSSRSKTPHPPQLPWLIPEWQLPNRPPSPKVRSPKNVESTTHSSATNPKTNTSVGISNKSTDRAVWTGHVQNRHLSPKKPSRWDPTSRPPITALLPPMMADYARAREPQSASCSEINNTGRLSQLSNRDGSNSRADSKQLNNGNTPFDSNVASNNLPGFSLNNAASANVVEIVDLTSDTNEVSETESTEKRKRPAFPATQRRTAEMADRIVAILKSQGLNVSEITREMVAKVQKQLKAQS